ncbi:metallophosphoesterase family protein [Erythrobacter crassostreae]|uniref:Metallophosphoesterase n=1 Tax=Erythrobacter crassostreae TaxID=2828328 RepID=A0A9X1F1V2_9SPHN|nr:metallophosphoesterase [Erythrobacter crassostrea]MBV7258599.1 metallophosphoesterase [Erythrobacter crassostrea]
MTTRLIHISDVHFGVEDRGALAIVERAIAEEAPDALVCTGDLTQRAKHSEYEAAAKWFGSKSLPVVLDPGNHDMPYYNLWERFTDPYRRYRALKSKVGGVLQSSDVVLVPLKTTVRAQARFPWSDGVVTPAALEQTLRRLASLEGDARTKIVTAHHPLLGPAGARSNPTIGGDRAFAALAEAGAHAVISGHVHVPFDEMRSVNGQTMRMIGAGTLSTRLRHGAPPSFRYITCGPEGQIEAELCEVPLAS